MVVVHLEHDFRLISFGRSGKTLRIKLVADKRYHKTFPRISRGIIERNVCHVNHSTSVSK